MPFTTTHFYIAIIGTSYSTTERWQFGLRATRAGTETSMSVIAASLTTQVQTWWSQSSGQRFGSLNTHTLSEIKVSTLDVDGLQFVNVPSGSFFFVPPVAGADVPPAGVAPQNTCAMTLTTSLPRGLASRGRCFLPPSSHLLPQSDGRLLAVDAKAMADGFKSLINGINGNPNIGDVVVMSRGRAVRGPALPNGKPTYTYPNPGVTNIVTGVQCGRVVDTQRRRRRALVEAPVAATT